MSLVIQGNLPGHFANRRGGGSLAAAKAGVMTSFAVVSFRGKVWRVKYRGEETVIRDQRGQPVQALDVVIVGASSAISKAFYQRNFTDGDDQAPVCASTEGIRPDAGVAQPQAKLCATCPNNAWGSAVTENEKRAKACRDSKRLAVVPYGDVPNELYGGPMLLSLPPTTLANFASYAEMLERKGVGDINWVGTRLSFDSELAYPRITFEPIAYVDEVQDAQVADIIRSSQYERVLFNTTAGVVAGEEEAEEEDDDRPIAGSPPARPAPRGGAVVTMPVRPKKTVVIAAPPPEDEDDGEDGDDEGEEDNTPPAAAANPFAAKTSPAAATAARGRTKAATARQAKAQQAAPAMAPANLDEAIDNLLDSPT